MKRFVSLLTLLSSMIFSEVINQPADQKLLSAHIPVVDIRTPGEWKETGLLKDSIPITFFDERGRYNVDAFMKALNTKVDTSKPFALICRTGSRTSMLAPFLSKQFHYTVYNLQGGIIEARRQGLAITPFKSLQ